ncbi:MAG TPA: acyl-protein synthetase [Desulfobacteraceae bacterium]|nr:acyl-protein synthetase [Desulfobacteraceae bacterium]
MRLSEIQIYNEAVLLPDNLKISLIERLLESIQTAIDSDTEKLQIQEAKIRRDEIRSGKVQPLIGEHVLARVRAMTEK